MDENNKNIEENSNIDIYNLYGLPKDSHFHSESNTNLSESYPNVINVPSETSKIEAAIISEPIEPQIIEQNQSPSPIVQPNTVQEESRNNKSSSSFLLVFIVMVLIVGFGIFFFLKIKKDLNKPTLPDSDINYDLNTEENSEVELTLTAEAEEIFDKIIYPQNFQVKTSTQVSAVNSSTNEWYSARYELTLARSDKNREKALLNIYGHNKLIVSLEVYSIYENSILSFYTKNSTSATNNKWAKTSAPYKNTIGSDYIAYPESTRAYLKDFGKLEKRNDATLNGKKMYVLKITMPYKYYKNFKVSLMDPFLLDTTIFNATYTINQDKNVESTIYIDAVDFIIMQTSTSYSSCVTNMSLNIPGYTFMTGNGFTYKEEFSNIDQVKNINPPDSAKNSSM